MQVPAAGQRKMRISIRTAGLTAALLGVGGWVVADAVEDSSTVRALPEVHAAAAPVRAASPEPQVPHPTFALPERALAEPSAALFSSHSWQPPPPKVVARPSLLPAPTAPTVPFRFVGRMLQDGHVSVFLGNADSVITAKQGDTIDGTYRVESISETEIALIYMPLKQRQTIQVVSSLPGALSPTVVAAPATVTPAAVAATPAISRASAPIPAASVIAPGAIPPASASPAAAPAAQLHSRR